MTESSSPGWKRIERAYFPPDGPRSCFVETDPAISGNPLWPRDQSFDSVLIAANIARASRWIEKVGGRVVAGHVPLSPDRSSIWQTGLLLVEPIPLGSTYVTATFIPKSAICSATMGFHVRDGMTPSLANIRLPQKGRWLLSNLGFFMTPKLIINQGLADLPFAHNRRVPHSEHLLPMDCSYLGGVLQRDTSGAMIEVPPLFPASGLMVTRDGQLHTIRSTSLRGGRCIIGSTVLSWTAHDVNPIVPGEIAVYTPGFLESQSPNPDSWQTFRQQIGDSDRIVLRVINRGNGHFPEPVAYVSKGPVVQPASAIVISVAKSIWGPSSDFAKVLGKAEATPVSFQCEPWWQPERPKDKIRHIYQGLVELGPNGVDWSSWTHPHALMTQETFLPNMMRREPRAVVVETLHSISLITFSGRYELSVGLSWQELQPVLNTLFTEYWPGESITHIVGLDGGSSVKLCLIEDGEIFPLHWAAPGARNTFGDPLGNTSSTLMIRIGQ